MGKIRAQHHIIEMRRDGQVLSQNDASSAIGEAVGQGSNQALPAPAQMGKVG